MEGPMGCTETLVRNYQQTLRDIQKSADLIHFAAEV